MNAIILTFPAKFNRKVLLKFLDENVKKIIKIKNKKCNILKIII
jgi:hypothetical protein